MSPHNMSPHNANLHKTLASSGTLVYIGANHVAHMSKEAASYD